MISPTVITSKPAQRDYDKIVAKHADLVMGMANQKMRVDMVNAERDQQKATEMQNNQTMQTELKKSQMVADTASEKNHLDFASKQAEIDTKRAALSQ